MVIIWAILAIIFSAFWGVYGCKDEKKEFWKKDWKDGWIKPFGIFFSEFIGSLTGWYCFYILTRRIYPDYKAFVNVDIFLVIGAVVGMAGYSYKIADFLDKLIDKTK